MPHSPVLSGAQTKVDAALATQHRIEADLDDSQLKAPRNGRVQYRVAERVKCSVPVARVVNMVDLSDVYMTFFRRPNRPDRRASGSDVHIILDAAGPGDPGENLVCRQCRAVYLKRWKQIMGARN